MMPKLPGFLLIFFYWLNAGGQSLYFNHLSVDNGLSQGVNNCIYRDSRGFVWISSFDGLNRFDGLSCQVFRAASSSAPGLKGTLFLNILEDASGDVWIGSNQGLNKYDRVKDNFENILVPNPENQDKFYSPFYIDEKQNIWVQSGSKLLVYNKKSKAFSAVKLPFNGGNLLVKTNRRELYSPVTTLYVINKNEPELWVGNLNKGEFVWEKHVPGLSGKRINNFTVSGKNGEIILGTNEGLYVTGLNLPYKDARLIPGTSLFNISSLHFDEERRLWAGTFRDGLLRIDGENWNLEQQYKPSPFQGGKLSGSQVQYVTTDNSRNLWVSVWGKGVDFTSLSKFRFNYYLSAEDVARSNADNFIRSIIQVGDELWCGTQSSGILILDSTKKIKSVLNKTLPPAIEHLMVHDKTVYAATLNGLFTVNIHSGKVEKISFRGEAFTAGQFNFISLLDDKTLLLSTNNGLYSAPINSLHPTLKSMMGSGEVFLTTYKDSKNRFYISRAFKGFSVCSLHNDSFTVTRQFPMEATVKCFYETDSIIWIGTTTGLIRFNKENLSIQRVFSVNDGLSNQYIYGIVPAGDFLWLSTNAGLNRFNTKDYSVKAFTTRHGLQSNEFNTYSFCKTTSGEILFGGVNGLNGFSGSSILNNDVAPQLALTSLLVNDSLYRFGINYAELDSLQLNYHQNTLSLQFTVIDYSSPFQNHISYMLDGFDKNWISATNKSFIRYTNLPPGNYLLKVKAYNADGVMASKLYTLQINVQTPWWQKWWFSLFMIAAVVTIVVLSVREYFRRKLRRQKILMEKDLAVEQERNRVAQDLHDGLGGMLSGIKHSLSALNGGMGTSVSNKSIIGNTITMLDSSITELRRVAFNMMPESMLRFGLDASLRDYCYELSATGTVSVAYQSYHVQDWQPDHKAAIGIYRMVQELVTNAIKHSNASQVIVQLIKDGTKLNITVEDNGQGFDTNLLKHSKGMGWVNLANRVAYLKGSVEVNSEPGKGTSIVINCIA
jgi:signal transduction histidine kinase/ligand-binding sensor domain-containing protein